MINYKIDKKNFELIGHSICAILKAEFNNQWKVHKNEAVKCVQVFRERTTPIQDVEMDVVNLSYASSDYDNKNQGTKSGDNIYFIDVYTNANSQRDKDNDYLANVQLQAIMRVIDGILEDPIYKKLDFTTPKISGTMVQRMEIMYPKSDSTDALSSCFGRITFQVRANENTGLIDGLLVAGSTTKVKVDGDPRGFLYEMDTNEE